MDTVISLLVLSTLPQLVVPQAAPPVTSFRAVVEMVSGESRIFSGESVRLKCSIPDVHRSSWNYLWFRGSEQLPQSGEHLYLWNARVQESGKYYCQGVRDTAVGDIHTMPSLPLEINVDGGWAILQVPPHPGLVGHTLKVTCRVRASPPLHEVILYKDGVEVMRQNGLDPHLYLTNLTLEDQGMYSCRASWDIDRRTRSVTSVKTRVQVLEVLSQPILEIVPNNNLIPVNRMKLICHVQYNAPAPAPPVHYYFYRDNERLGTATSENNDLVRRTPGQYSCRAKVPELGIARLSEPKSFGVKGPQTMRPPTLHPSDPWPLAPPISSPDLSLPPAAEPTAARPSPQRSTAAPTIIQPTEVSIRSSDPALKLSQPTTISPISTVQTLDRYDDEMSGESGDWPEQSGDWPEQSGDLPKGSGDLPKGSGDWSKGSGDLPEGSGDWPEGSGDWPEGSGDWPEGSGDWSKGSGDLPEGSGDWPEGSGDWPEGSGDWPEGSGDWSKGSDDMP